MNDEWQTISVRIGLYLSLMLLFGAPFFGLVALRPHERVSLTRGRMGGVLASTGLLGGVLSLFGMVVMARSMSGAEEYASIERHVYEMLLLHTNVGLAWLVRMGALAAVVWAALYLARWPTLWLTITAACGGVALSSLAWSGHGAMDEGARGLLHLSADILHLLAAAAWLGSIAMFILLSACTRVDDANRIELLSRALNGFAMMGTLIVVTLAITGIINYWLINGWTFQALTSTLYGTLFICKFLAFLLMLGVAGANRYLLSPRLEVARLRGDAADAVKALQKSLTVELVAATAILILIAWLGILSPLS